MNALLSTIAALALVAAARPQAVVAPGVDRVAEQGSEHLRGRRCGLITNHTGVTQDGRRTIDVLAAREDVELLAIFSPEHGLQGALDEAGIAHGTDAATGLPVWSLYGETRRPLPAMLEGLDTLVFDIQDIGCRFYTYVSTMGLALSAAADHDLRFVVLDRPNPIDGLQMAGPLLDRGRESFVGHHTIPVRHGMTAGELMRMLIGEKGLRVDGRVVECVGWSRSMTYDQTGLLWIDPSPNMRSLTEALLYPGIGLIEGTNLSVGRGTDTPFEIVGAPWIEPARLWARLQAAELPGVAFVPARFTPTASKFAGERCGGVQLAITDRTRFEPIATGLTLACALRDLYPTDWEHDRLMWLLGNQATYDAFAAGKPFEALEAGWRQSLDVFRMRRKPFLIYR